jgi:hypothetical protein
MLLNEIFSTNIRMMKLISSFLLIIHSCSLDKRYDRLNNNTRESKLETTMLMQYEVEGRTLNGKKEIIDSIFNYQVGKKTIPVYNYDRYSCDIRLFQIGGFFDINEVF